MSVRLACWLRLPSLCLALWGLSHWVVHARDARLGSHAICTFGLHELVVTILNDYLKRKYLETAKYN